LPAGTADGPRSKVKVSSGGSVGRVWWEEGEREEEREQRRRGEQATRNARLVYNLQRQVTLLYSLVESEVLTLALVPSLPRSTVYKVSYRDCTAASPAPSGAPGRYLPVPLYTNFAMILPPLPPSLPLPTHTHTHAHSPM